MVPGAGGLGGQSPAPWGSEHSLEGKCLWPTWVCLPEIQEPAGLQSSLCIWGTRVSTGKGGGGFLGVPGPHRGSRFLDEDLAAEPSGTC